MSETVSICKNCGKAIAPGAVCLDCTVTDLQVGSSLEHSLREAPHAYLVEHHSNQQYPIKAPKSKIGRDPTNQIVLPNDSYCSRFHVWITLEDGHYFVEDLGSTNGTLLNGSPLIRRRPLVNGDRLRIGRSDFTFVLEPVAAASGVKRQDVSGT